MCPVLMQRKLCMALADVVPCCDRLRDEHTLRIRAQSELETVAGEATALKERLQEVTAGQAQAARLAADLEVQCSLYRDAKAQAASLENR